MRLVRVPARSSQGRLINISGEHNADDKLSNNRAVGRVANNTVKASRGFQIRAGVKDSLSVGLGIFPLGIGLGFLVVQAGLPWWIAPALSVGIFAGSVEFIMVGLLSTFAPLITVAVTVLAVNFRHVFYAFSFPVHLTKPGAQRTYSIYAMIDEAYATAVMVPEKEQTAPRLLAMQLSCQFYWVIGALLGVGIAGLFPQTLDGFEFALVALFTVMTLDSFRGKQQVPQTLLAGLSVSAALVFVPDSAMLASLIIFFVLLAFRFLLTKKSIRQNDPDASLSDAEGS